MKIPEFVKRIAGFLTGAVSLLLSWSIAYWLTSLLYVLIGWTPNGLVKQLITSFVGMVLFGCGVYFISNIKLLRNKQESYLNPLIHAMRKMANGNFNIDLSYYQGHFKRRNHPYLTIIENISDMAEKLGEMEEMRQEFISNVSHEIQSPLTSISGFAHTLKNENLTLKEREHYLGIIEMESIRLSRLSDNLLKLTALESDYTPCDFKSYRLDQQLRRIILANEPQWTEKELHMDISLKSATITGDVALLEQVWINLLHNGIKFTENEGEISIKVFETADKQVVVRFEDNGIGMNNDTLMHIFERFYKADLSRNRNIGGNGLGLPIVKKIIDLHEAKIEVQSKVGLGTKIVVTFDKDAGPL